MQRRPVVPVFGRPSINRSNIQSINHSNNQSDERFSPLPWQNYWDDAVDCVIDGSNDSFRVYTAGFKRPNDPSSNPASILLLLHGAGQSSLSWSLCVSHLKHANQSANQSINQPIHIMAIDLRGHGASKTDDDTDLSAETAISDLNRVIKQFFNPSNNQSIEIPSITVCGHSLGGALGIRLASKYAISSSQSNQSNNQLISLPISGCICVDMCEDTAIDNIQSIKQTINQRPDHFLSVENAIEWSVRVGMIRNVDSARVSIPDQLIPQSINQSISQSINQSNNQSVNQSTEEEDDDDVIGHHYIWRTDLLASENHWLGWFQNLSELFLSIKQPKLLILSDVERLDRAMSIAHMQGKIQVSILSSTGHQIMEDQPAATASIILQFWNRHQLGLNRLRSIAAFNTALLNCK